MATGMKATVFNFNKLVDYVFNCDVVKGISDHEMMMCDFNSESVLLPQNKITMFHDFNAKVIQTL